MIRYLLRWLERPSHQHEAPAEHPIYDDAGVLLFTINLARGCVVYPAKREREPHAE